MKINFILNKGLLFCFLLLLAACGGLNPTNQDLSAAAVRHWSPYLENLKQEILNRACGSRMREFYKDEIERQAKHLNPAQLEKSLKNMKEDMVCS